MVFSYIKNVIDSASKLLNSNRPSIAPDQNEARSQSEAPNTPSPAVEPPSLLATPQSDVASVFSRAEGDTPSTDTDSILYPDLTDALGDISATPNRKNTGQQRPVWIRSNLSEVSHVGTVTWTSHLSASPESVNGFPDDSPSKSAASRTRPGPEPIQSSPKSTRLRNAIPQKESKTQLICDCGRCACGRLKWSLNELESRKVHEKDHDPMTNDEKKLPSPATPRTPAASVIVDPDYNWNPSSKVNNLELAKLLPFDLSEILADPKGKCAGSVMKSPEDKQLENDDGLPHRRCKNTKIILREEVEPVLFKITELVLKKKMEAILGELSKLPGMIFCHSHRPVAQGIITKIESYLAPSQKNSKHRAERPGTHSKLLVDMWINHVTSHASKAVIAPLQRSNSIESIMFRNGNKTPEEVLLEVQSKTNSMLKKHGLAFFRPYRDKHSQVPTHLDLLGLLQEKLSPKKERADGFIYLFPLNDKQKNYSGFAKIGVTTDSAEARRKDICVLSEDFTMGENALETVCNRSKMIPNAHRVERLVHTELKTARRVKVCEGKACKNKSHIEWFEVDLDHALEVCQKWIKWAKDKPYGPNIRNPEAWTLTEKYTMKEMKDACRPIPRRQTTLTRAD